MSTLNAEGIRFVHDRTRPLGVDSMEAATKVLLEEVTRGSASATTPESWARHLAWVIGFDHLIADRKAIHKLTTMVVTDA